MCRTLEGSPRHWLGRPCAITRPWRSKAVGKSMGVKHLFNNNATKAVCDEEEWSRFLCRQPIRWGARLSQEDYRWSNSCSVETGKKRLCKGERARCRGLCEKIGIRPKR